MTERSISASGALATPSSRWRGHQRGWWLLLALVVVGCGLALGGSAQAQPDEALFALTCTPENVDLDEEVVCTASAPATGGPYTFGWSPAGEGEGNQRVYRFDRSGGEQVNVAICADDGSGVPVPGSCQDRTARVAVGDAAPPITDLRCTPTRATVGETVLCSVASESDSVTFAWSAGPNTTVGRGVAPTFDTGFVGTGTATIRVDGCAPSRTRPEGRCRTLLTTVEVADAERPAIRSVACAPEQASLNQAVTCSATVEGPGESWRWFTVRGAPQETSLPSFTTVFQEPGRMPIILTVCAAGSSDRCDQATVVVQVAGELAPRIRTLGCAPDVARVNDFVRCVPSLEGGRTSFAWTAGPDASTASGNAGEFGTSFTLAGTKTITLQVCVDLGEGRPQACEELSQPITVIGGAPEITGAGCTPARAPLREPVACTAVVANPGPGTTLRWTAPGGNPESGPGDAFSTTYAQVGSRTITFEACNGTACASRPQTITVFDPCAVQRVDALDSQACPDRPPQLRTVECAPAQVDTNRPVACRFTADGAITSQRWTAADGNPSTGGSAGFSTSFASGGRKVINLQVCNGSACVNGQATVQVNAAPAGFPAGTFTLNGPFTMTSAPGGNCNTAYAPNTSGTMRIVLTFDGSSPTGSVNGSFNGGGSGSGRGSCNGVTGEYTWSQTYTGQFSGTIDRTSGALTITSGTISGNQNNRNFNCKDGGGRDVTCPNPPAGPYSFSIRVTGQVALNGSGSGGFTVQGTSLATSATWSVSGAISPQAMLPGRSAGEEERWRVLAGVLAPSGGLDRARARRERIHARGHWRPGRR